MKSLSLSLSVFAPFSTDSTCPVGQVPLVKINTELSAASAESLQSLNICSEERGSGGGRGAKITYSLDHGLLFSDIIKDEGEVNKNGNKMKIKFNG